MKFLAVILLALCLAVVSEAASTNTRHSRHFKRVVKRCEGEDHDDGEGEDSNAEDNSADAVPEVNTASSGSGGTISGLLNVASTCGDIGATSDSKEESGPNGALYWLNCGIENEGWRPQDVKVSDLKVVDLNNALQDPNSPFKACERFIDKFVQYGNEFSIPPILLASFAMQESTCNPDVNGGGGEVGLMQITPEKCDGAPGGNCHDPDFNIRTGAQFFKTTLENAGGNALQAMGQYNGWQPGMTVSSATAAATSGCCRCQNNLDYLFQMVNGWLQNIDPGTRRLGKYFNLDVCN